MDLQYIATMLEHYVEAALWSSTYNTDDNGGEDGGEDVPFDDTYGPEDVAPEALEDMRADVIDFATSNAADLAAIDPAQAGHDFWLTRNGHGAGFWDRGLGDVGKRLTDACRPYGSSDLYVGAGGKVHVS